MQKNPTPNLQTHSQKQLAIRMFWKHINNLRFFKQDISVSLTLSHWDCHYVTDISPLTFTKQTPETQMPFSSLSNQASHAAYYDQCTLSHSWG